MGAAGRPGRRRGTRGLHGRSHRLTRTRVTDNQPGADGAKDADDEKEEATTRRAHNLAVMREALANPDRWYDGEAGPAIHQIEAVAHLLGDMTAPADEATKIFPAVLVAASDSAPHLRGAQDVVHAQVAAPPPPSRPGATAEELAAAAHEATEKMADTTVPLAALAARLAETPAPGEAHLLFVARITTRPSAHYVPARLTTTPPPHHPRGPTPAPRPPHAPPPPAFWWVRRNGR